jgi:hypothetical protein
MLARQYKATVLPMHPHSTEKNNRHILEKHLIPRFGEMTITGRGDADFKEARGRPQAGRR